MHGKSGPRTDIDIAVVNGMHPLVEGRPVQKAVDEIEMNPLVQGQQGKQQ